MNADVIIQNDTWILDIVKNDIDTSLIYIDCQRFDNQYKMHTDFFGLKLSALSKGQLLNDAGNAEMAFTQQMMPIIEKRQHKHLPDSYPLFKGYCRVNGNLLGPVFHFQDDFGIVANVEGGICPAVFNNLN